MKIIFADGPISNEHCDWLYGIFGHETSCTRYWTCWNGTATEQLCIGGLLYNEKAHSCDWPEVKISSVKLFHHLRSRHHLSLLPRDWKKKYENEGRRWKNFLKMKLLLKSSNAISFYFHKFLCLWFMVFLWYFIFYRMLKDVRSIVSITFDSAPLFLSFVISYSNSRFISINNAHDDGKMRKRKT